MSSPFKFLDAYTREDRDIFFGRDNEIEEVYDKLFKSNLLLIYGASGTGKTSLIDCGVASKFQEMDWFPVHVRRRQHLLESLESEIRKRALTPLEAGKPLADSLQSLYLDFFKPLYLIFDQFEELFISGDEEERQAFLSFLTQLLEREDFSCKVIISIREEYLAWLTGFEESITTLFDNRVRIERMTPANAREVVVQSCRSFGIEMEEPEGVARRIVEKLQERQAGIELTYLQVYLDKLYQQADANGGRPVEFSYALIEETGEIEDVLASFLHQQVAQMPTPETAWEVLKSFITSEGTKKTINVPQILQSLRERGHNISEKQLERLLTDFIKLKIIRTIDE